MRFCRTKNVSGFVFNLGVNNKMIFGQFENSVAWHYLDGGIDLIEHDVRSEKAQRSFDELLPRVAIRRLLDRQGYDSLIELASELAGELQQLDQARGLCTWIVVWWYLRRCRVPIELLPTHCQPFATALLAIEAKQEESQHGEPTMH